MVFRKTLNEVVMRLLKSARGNVFFDKVENLCPRHILFHYIGQQGTAYLKTTMPGKVWAQFKKMMT